MLCVILFYKSCTNQSFYRRRDGAKMPVATIWFVWKLVCVLNIFPHLMSPCTGTHFKSLFTKPKYRTRPTEGRNMLLCTYKHMLRRWAYNKFTLSFAMKNVLPSDAFLERETRFFLRFADCVLPTGLPNIPPMALFCFDIKLGVWICFDVCGYAGLCHQGNSRCIC